MRRLLIGTIALLISSCTMGVPAATPTVAPTLTPSATALASLTFTPSLAPTLSATFIAQVASPSLTATLSPTPTESLTPTFTPSDTLTPSTTPSGTHSSTPIPTDTPSPTLTPAPTDTPIPTVTLPPSPTPLPTIGSSPTPIPTDTPPPTATITPSFTPLPSPFTPSPTLTPSARPTDTPAPTSTRLPTLTPIPSWTPRVLPPLPQIATAGVAPVGAPSTTPALIPPTAGVAPIDERSATFDTVPPTQNATPTLITAEPGQVVPPGFRTATPITGDGSAIPATPTALPQPVQATFAPTFLPQPILSNPPDPAVRSFALIADGVPFNFTLPDASTFAQNPVNPNIFARVDSRGMLYLISDFSAGTQSRAAFNPFTYEPENADVNPARVRRVVWSRDGVYVAYLIDQWSDGQNTQEENDGVWIADGGFLVSGQVLRDCHPDMLRACTVNRSAGPYTYRSLEMAWGADTNHLLLIRVYIYDDANRAAFTLVETGQNPNNQPSIYRYEYASWAWDGTRLLVSGYGGVDGQAAIRWFDPISRTEGQTLFNGSAMGVVISYAVQRPTGQIVALGSTGGAGGVLRLYDVSGTPISGDIGTSAPVRVEWSPDRSAVLVVTNDGTRDRYYVASAINGAVSEITGNVGDAPVVEWINRAP